MQLNCKNTTQNAPKPTNLRAKSNKNFLGPSPDPSPSGEGDIPSPQHALLGTSILAPPLRRSTSAPTAPRPHCLQRTPTFLFSNTPLAEMFSFFISRGYLTPMSHKGSKCRPRQVIQWAFTMLETEVFKQNFF